MSFGGGGDRSSFFRVGVEMHERDDVTLPTEGSPPRRNDSGGGGGGAAAGRDDGLSSPLLSPPAPVSDSYTGWWGGGANDDSEDTFLRSDPAPSAVGRSLKTFLATASSALDGSARRERIAREEEGRRDSTDMFSPNNFAADLRNMSLSITERNDEVDGEGDADDIVIGGDGGGGGFELDRDEGEFDFDLGDVEGGGDDPLTARI